MKGVKDGKRWCVKLPMTKGFFVKGGLSRAIGKAGLKNPRVKSWIKFVTFYIPSRRDDSW
jgi:hypothetical protein